MIIACSNTTIQLVKEAVYRRIGKGDGWPLIIEDKRQLARVRKHLSEQASTDKLVWNLHLTETRVQDDGDVVGRVITGYLYQREPRLAIVLNSLDDADLCRIGQTVHNAIETALDDCYVNRHATTAYLEAADEISNDAIETCELKPHRLENGWFDRTLIVPNSSRKAASGLTQIRNLREERLFGNGHAAMSSTPIDRTANYHLNNRLLKYETGSTKRDSAPCIEVRRMVASFAEEEFVPTVELKISLICDGFTTRHYKNPYNPDTPECWRKVRIPLDAPLSWVHCIIQKVFNWYDYHLHRFAFLDYEARELFDLLFNVEFDVHDFMDDEAPVEKKDRLANAGGLGHFEKLTGLGAKWFYHDFAPYAEREILDEDFPSADLPEDVPIGLHLFGEENYRLLMENATNPKINMSAADVGRTNSLYYNYDFGDDWDLAITPVRITCEPAGTLPRVVDGAGHTPPEDCGGLGGFENVIAAYELTAEATCDTARAALREQLKREMPAEWVDDLGPDVEAELDYMLEEELKEAKGTMSWAYNVVGWYPFSREESIDNVFDTRGRMI